MPHKIFIFCIALALMSSCATNRTASSRSKPEIIETGYNLIRAKLNKLGLLEKYVVEMDTASCSHAVWKDYHNSWLAELLDIGEEKQKITFGYVLSVVGKPYWKSAEHFWLEHPQRIFTTTSEWNPVVKANMCLETLPDTALETIPVSFSALLNTTSTITAEEVITIARNTFQLDAQFRCIRSLPSEESFLFGVFHPILPSPKLWAAAFEIQPSDSILYYLMKQDTSITHQEIMTYIRQRAKINGWCFCPEYILSVCVDIADKRVTDVRLIFQVSSGGGFSPGPRHLLAITSLLEGRIRKWREANADYIKSKQ